VLAGAGELVLGHAVGGEEGGIGSCWISLLLYKRERNMKGMIRE
jgi:hypothetical protein